MSINILEYSNISDFYRITYSDYFTKNFNAQDAGSNIRTLNDTLVSVPNCIIAHGAIENFSKREKMLYHPDLPLQGWQVSV